MSFHEPKSRPEFKFEALCDFEAAGVVDGCPGAVEAVAAVTDAGDFGAE
jgi:hypothetical protein